MCTLCVTVIGNSPISHLEQVMTIHVVLLDGMLSKIKVKNVFDLESREFSVSSSFLSPCHLNKG